MSKSRLIASGLAVGLAGAVALGYAAPHLGKTFLSARSDLGALSQAAPPPSALQVADKKETAPAVTPSAKADAGRDVVVEAPHTSVRVGKDSGKVAVRAPYTDVKVDPDRNQVRVRAPYVNLDIRW